MNKRIAIVCEGESRELKYWENIRSVFFLSNEYTIIPLPAGQNLYMLWKTMRDDEFETDVIEVLRESHDECRKRLEGIRRDEFQEVFLFFDYDPHQNNLSRDDADCEDVLRQMLDVFDNETENGKLYLSYPMIEAIRDYLPGGCRSFYKCFVPVTEMTKYKSLSAEGNKNVDYRKYDYTKWREICDSFIGKCRCLYGELPVFSPDFEWYKSKVNSNDVFDRIQIFYRDRQEVFVLSCLPEFLLDYYPIEYWKKRDAEEKYELKRRAYV